MLNQNWLGEIEMYSQIQRHQMEEENIIALLIQCSHQILKTFNVFVVF